MVKTRDPTCCWDIFKTKGSNEEILLRMVEEERGVAVVRNDSNNEPTPYISSKKPSTLPLNGAQTIYKHITAQPFHRKHSLVPNKRNNRNTIRNPYQALPINHRPSKPLFFNATIKQNNNPLRFMRVTLTLNSHKKKSREFIQSFSDIKLLN